MRGLLVVNPHATTTSPRVRDVLVRALGDAIDLEIVTTEHRGHAWALGERARRERLDIVCTLGGDGTINEVVNGMLSAGPGDDVPLLATVPGGSANVFARSLGLPADPVEATGVLLEAISEHHVRRIGLGTAAITSPVGHTSTPRWFVANAGLGVDAEIIAAMENDRAEGHEASPGRYFTTTLRQYFLRTERKDPPLRIEIPGEDPIDDAFLAIVQNTAPWTYFGSYAVNPCPRASFDTGLDLFAVRRMGVATALRVARRMLAGSDAGSTRRSLAVRRDLAEFAIEARRPTHLQIDGEGLGEVQRVAFRSVSDVLGVFC